MEENTVELFDYLRVIWKRKILIIVVISVCIGVGVGVGVMNSMSKLPVTYQADVIVKVGQKLIITPSSGVSSAIHYIENPGDLKSVIPRRYGFNFDNVSGYHLDIEQIGNLSMLKLTLKGPDMGVERVLKEVVDMLIADHRGMASTANALYAGFINKLEADVIMFQENIDVIKSTIKELKRRGGMYLEYMVETGVKGKEDDKSGGGQSAFLNMLYLKTVEQEGELSRNRRDLRSTQWQLILYSTTMGDRKKYDTEMIGEVKRVAIIPNRKGVKDTIIVAGVAGLVMSLFIAFFIEYIVESKSKRKGKWQG